MDRLDPTERTVDPLVGHLLVVHPDRTAAVVEWESVAAGLPQHHRQVRHLVERLSIELGCGDPMRERHPGLDERAYRDHQAVVRTVVDRPVAIRPLDDRVDVVLGFHTLVIHTVRHEPGFDRATGQLLDRQRPSGEPAIEGILQRRTVHKASVSADRGPADQSFHAEEAATGGPVHRRRLPFGNPDGGQAFQRAASARR